MMQWHRIARRPLRWAVALRVTAAAMLIAAWARPIIAQQARSDDSTALAALPLHESPVSTAGAELAFLITGDGGYAAADRGIADALVARGVPVVALDAREYLKKKRTPDEAASVAALIMRHYLTAWHRDSVIYVGYSRGADMAPFIVTRLPADLRSRLSLVAMIGLAEHASFEFHWTDLVTDTNRPTDLLVAPEVLKIQGVRMLCLYGTHEKGSLCPTFPPSVLRADQHGGKHTLSGRDGAAVAERILRELAFAGSA
ncbi:MAG TPA: AcvB/VirJ family lysyl-phosphatidylglycerol hydrolase [Gemmatimonadaceae bacterium]|nr:AcvB/VirJ family lysyl-phosphatidylglycerol hydrolase [Gemmatimonadaceae bacterium]